ncbi:MAG: hypothetical protein ABSD57_14315, partial [Verrucomicrobiota bacterium]
MALAKSYQPAAVVILILPGFIVPLAPSSRCGSHKRAAFHVRETEVAEPLKIRHGFKPDILRFGSPHKNGERNDERIDSKRKLPWEGRNGLREPYVDSKRVLPSYAPENESNYPS